MSAVCPVPQKSSPVPHISTDAPQFVVVDTHNSAESALCSLMSCIMKAIPTVSPYTDPWGTPLCGLSAGLSGSGHPGSILHLPSCPHLQLSLTCWVTGQLWDTVQKPSQGILQHPQPVSHHPMNPCMSKQAEQSRDFFSSAVDAASLPQEKVEGCTAFKAERKLMNPPKCCADFHNEYVSILLE